MKHRNQHKDGLSQRAAQSIMLFAYRKSILFSFILLAIIILMLVASLWEIEPRHENPIWRALIYLVSGMDVDPPDTWEGKIVALFLLVAGVISVSLFTGLVAAKFSRILSSFQYIKEKPRKEIFHDHIIIFGWGEKTRAILRELNQKYIGVGPGAKKIVIVSEEQQLVRGREQIYNHVWKVSGKATDEQTLKKANLCCPDGKGAQLALILSDSSSASEEADRGTLLNALAVEHLYPPVISLAEVKKQSNSIHFKHACVDQTFIPDLYATFLLAKTTAFPGIAGYIEDLLSLKPRPAKNNHSYDLLFKTVSAESVSGIGQHLSDLILSVYEAQGVLICGLCTAGAIQLIPDLPNINEYVVSATDEFLTIAKEFVA